MNIEAGGIRQAMRGLDMVQAGIHTGQEVALPKREPTILLHIQNGHPSRRERKMIRICAKPIVK